MKQDNLRFEDISQVITKKGSIYTYLEDGRTQRFKKATGELHKPQDILVFVPDYDTLINASKKNITSIIGENEFEYGQYLLEYAQVSPRTCFVINKDGIKIEKNKDAKNEKLLFLALYDKKSDKVDFTIPVSHIPRIGYNTFDTRKYQEGNEWYRDRHLGNKVISIIDVNNQSIDHRFN